MYDLRITIFAAASVLLRQQQIVIRKSYIANPFPRVYFDVFAYL